MELGATGLHVNSIMKVVSDKTIGRKQLDFLAIVHSPLGLDCIRHISLLVAAIAKSTAGKANTTSSRLVSQVSSLRGA